VEKKKSLTPASKFIVLQALFLYIPENLNLLSNTPQILFSAFTFDPQRIQRKALSFDTFPLISKAEVKLRTREQIKLDVRGCVKLRTQTYFRLSLDWIENFPFPILQNPEFSQNISEFPTIRGKWELVPILLLLLLLLLFLAVAPINIPFVCGYTI